ncbi:MAG: TonB-dependent receptor plug domain-containing protein [Bacteroidales bacterium]|nr:TonB-dependent receptor plug domain-containing protein [Bacteroidales bacterium]
MIERKIDKEPTLKPISMIAIDRITSGGIEKILNTQGVFMRSEFSSQYSVRGGNYDENLTYINDIEIYRPLLVKSGQQEGLSIINPDMVSGIQFSAGGFAAHYGDKMSSVLDIKYKRPSGFGGSFSGSLLGASSHVEMASKNKKFTGIAGVRYKSNKYLLNKLHTKGSYKPTFIDFQSFFTYDISRKFEVSLLTNISDNQYQIVPQEEETEFGTSVDLPLRWTVFYDGQEIDRFSTYMGAFTINFHPNEKLSLKLINSGFMTNEEITYDIQGQYLIDAVDKQKDSAINLGVGTYLQHARNFLNGQVYSSAFKGRYLNSKNDLKWGITFQIEDIDDKIREWEMIDSAGYSIPYSKNDVHLNKTTRSNNRLITQRTTAYVQNTYEFFGKKGARYFLTTGIRAHHWSLNDQVVISPRIILSATPQWNRDVKFHAAFGYYFQPPFYKELRDSEGVLHKDIKAQKSVHYVIGNQYNFFAWTRPFVFSTEIYYKHLWNIIPYKVDDVDIQYLPQYIARGYATGIEFKINGEFVENAESWATLSLMRTREDIYRDYYLLPDKTVVSPGYYRRPTDQFLQFGLFFQDYLPTNPDYKIHLNLIYGTNLPYGLPTYDIPSKNITLRPYQRADIGFSKSLKKFFAVNSFDDIWFNFEIFNLFGVENQASFNWIKAVENELGLTNYFAVPNYLTGRIFNVKLSARF